MAEAIARVHVDDYDPEVYRGENALEMALMMARQMRHDFPGATVGVSYNPQAADEKRANALARYGVDSADSGEAKCICDGWSFGQPTHPFIVNVQCLVHGVLTDSEETE